MAESYKDVFVTQQQRLAANPARALATILVETLQARGLASEARLRDFRLVLDEPTEIGGADRGPRPIELVLAALGACQEITYRLYADTLGIPLRGVSVRLEGRLDYRGLFAVKDGIRPGFRDVRAVVTIDSPASAEDLDRLKAAVDRHCPVLDILRNVTPVQVGIDHINSATKPAAA